MNLFKSNQTNPFNLINHSDDKIGERVNDQAWDHEDLAEDQDKFESALVSLEVKSQIKPENLKALYSYGLAFLTGREASQNRLFQKLLTRGSAEECKIILNRLAREGWVSDRRFAESYTHYRSERGFGPKHIEYALRQEGLSLDLIQEVFAEMAIDWQELVEKLVHRKFPEISNFNKARNPVKVNKISNKTIHKASDKTARKVDKSQALRAKVERFLIARGFDWEQIRKVWKALDVCSKP